MKKLLLILLCVPLIGLGQKNKDCNSNPDYRMTAEDFIRSIENNKDYIKYDTEVFEILLNFNKQSVSYGGVDGEGNITDAKVWFEFKEGDIGFDFSQLTKSESYYLGKLFDDKKKTGYTGKMIKIQGAYISKESELRRDKYRKGKYEFKNCCLLIPSKKDKEENILYGEINDPDGYTNVREGKSSKSDILFKVYRNKRFKIIDNNGSWWLIEYNGQQGYMYKDRIDIIK